MNKDEQGCPKHFPSCLNCGGKGTVPTRKAFLHAFRRASGEPTMDLFQALTWITAKTGGAVPGNYDLSLESFVDQIRIASGNSVMNYNDALVWVER